jgi:hypothetical protein
MGNIKNRENLKQIFLEAFGRIPNKSYIEGDKEEYLRDLMKYVQEFCQAYHNLLSLWYQDQNAEIDANDYLVEDYPFDLSFDELNIEDELLKSANNNNFITNDTI